MEWESVGDGRVRFEHPDGFIVIKPEGSKEVVPLLCPVCDLSMLTADDSAVFRVYKCCALCALRWVDINKKEWLGGWRPDKDDIEAERKRRNTRRPSIHL